MINCFCGMVDHQKVFSLISIRDHCQRSSPSRISDMPWAGFEPAQSLGSGLVEWSSAVVVTTTPQRHYTMAILLNHLNPFSMTKVICWKSLKIWQKQVLTSSKVKFNFESLTWTAEVITNGSHVQVFWIFWEIFF